eukprot:3554050-Pyramimonas_sp.AAC.1
MERTSNNTEGQYKAVTARSASRPCSYSRGGVARKDRTERPGGCRCSESQGAPGGTGGCKICPGAAA